MKTKQKLFKNLAFIASMMTAQFTCANMFSPFAVEASILNFDNNESMYLGDWKNTISEKLNPTYFSRLDNNSNQQPSISSVTSSTQYVINQKRFIVPVFADSFTLNNFNNDIGLYFSFSNVNQSLSSFGVEQLLYDLSNTKINRKSKKYSYIVGQDSYTPTYVLSKGNSSFGIGAVFVQQRFLDDAFGNTVLKTTSTSQITSDKTLYNINRGTGYQLSFSHKLPANIYFDVNYRSKIEMNEFDTFGNSYSESGDFDIPRQYSFSLSVPFLQDYKLNLSSENIEYSDTNVTVHSGYSPSFLRAYSSPIRKIFKLDDLTVYTFSVEKQFNDSLLFEMSVLSRQQAPATAEIYNKILKNDTAEFSYRLGFSKLLPLGQINFHASFANKPLLIGSTEFGRLNRTELTRHIEGVASWSFNF